MQKVNVYIDGFNFYNGLRDKSWKQYYWLDIVKFSKFILKELNKEHELIETYYFSAPPHNHASKERRQKQFFDANKKNNKFNLVLGYHKDKSKSCNGCGIKIPLSEEKQTDVNIALWMLKKAVLKECDLSILISGDTDMIPIIQSIKELSPNHKVIVFFPPKRVTHQMRSYVDGWRDLSKYEELFKKSLLHEYVTIGKGVNIEIPQKWKNFQK